MSYEIFARKTRRLGSPGISFNANGIITFNKAAALKLKAEAVENVLVLWDAVPGFGAGSGSLPS